MQSCHENWKCGLKQIQGYKFYHPVKIHTQRKRERKGRREGGREGGREEWRKGGREVERERDMTSPICEKVRHVRSSW